MDSRPAPARRPRPGLALLVAALAATTAGCGLRIDTPAPTPPPADAVEQARQGAAADAQELVLSAEAATTQDARVAAILTTVAEGSARHVETLGGVWEAWPGGPPDGADVTPSPAPAAPAGVDAAAVLDLLVAGAEDARAAAVEARDGDLAGVLTAVAVWRTATARDLAAALGVGVELPGGEPYPVARLAAWDMDSTTALALDSARYTYEVAAARSQGPSREVAAARAAHLHDLSDVAAAALEQDPRQGAYALPEDDAGAVAGPDRLAVAAEGTLLQQLLFRLTLTPQAEREPLVSAALHVGEQLRRWGGQVPAVPASTES